MSTGGLLSIFDKKKSFVRQAGKKYILLVEDDATLADMYKMKLESDGFVVLISTDGKYALRDMKQYQPDLVLLDILMYGKDGFDVLTEKSKCPRPEIKNIPTIILTNLASPDDQAEGKRLGAADWWIKAYNTPAEVSDKVKKFLKVHPVK